MAISMHNFAKLHSEEFRAEIKERISEIIDNTAFIEGKYNTMFENEFAEMQGAKHALLVANGTDAIEIALKAYDVGKDDLVGIPGISFYATAEPVLNVGATPVFIDVDPVTGLMDPSSLKRITEKHKLKAIIPVHIYGLPAPIDELEKICHPLDIKIVEDGAQSHGAIVHTGPAGSSNNLTTFSFYPTKNLSAFGDAGAILTQDDKLAEKIISIRNHGRSPDGYKHIGRNSRCDSIQAAVIHLKLEKVTEYNKQRKQVAKKYHEGLKNTPLQLVDDKYVETSAWHLYPVQVESKEVRAKLHDFLKENDIFTALFYNKSLPEEATLTMYPGEKEAAKLFSEKVICLPLSPFLTDNDVATVIEKVKEFYK